MISSCRIGRNLWARHHQLLNRHMQLWCFPLIIHRGYVLDRYTQINGKSLVNSTCNSYNTFLSAVSIQLKHVRFRNEKSDIFDQFHDQVMLRDDFQLSLEEWTKLRNIIEKDNPNFAKGMDHSLMKMASTQKKPELAKSLMEFLKHIEKTSISTTLQFMLACCTKYEDLVLEELVDLEKDPKLKMLWRECALLIDAVSQTRVWEKAKIYYEWLPVDDPAFISSAFYILRASLKHKDYHTFFLFLHQYHVRNTDPSEQLDTIADLLFEEWQRGLYGHDVLLELLKVHNMYLKDYQAAAVQKHFNRLSPGSVALTTINKQSRWQCDHCGEYLTKDQPFTDSQIKCLGNHLAMQAFGTKNHFYTTEPGDHLQFKKMLTFCGPFDYVIDGENVALARGFSQIMNAFLSDLEVLRNQGKQILIIHRNVTLRTNCLPKAYVERIRKSCIVFTVSRKTYDDVYGLTAAMLSGKRCYLASSDFFRDHIARLDVPNQNLFWLWQKQCHLQIPSALGKQKSVFEYPNARCVTHESDLHWHVPYKLESEKKLPQPETVDIERRSRLDKVFPPHTFLCIRKPPGYNESEEVMKIRAARDKLQTRMTSKLEDSSVKFK
ncbi:mitochondrial ribonuclease P catalytic subunit-like isoform X1 [Dreissena polymorpha]|uniref:mitochondrial ribonuclease P catalytic subunit-like isoform X1 n=1 Tax=Dreissena polymorpha TaxID=45954 RepID=UPI0022645DE8|nr:mitochondrial ribonuclease P catalytic subunit-like isoform X1 [Dreissena polymorpha]